MNSGEIDAIIKATPSNETAVLPCGEFEGPIVISHPCTICGNNTTIWCLNGTSVDIRSDNVTLRDITIEITGGGADDAAIDTHGHNTAFENVTVYGNTLGVDGDSGTWEIPDVIRLGRIPSNEEFVFYAEIRIPAAAHLINNISGVTVSPTELPPGKNCLCFTVDPLAEGVSVCGEIEFCSVLKRKTVITFSASDPSRGFAPDMNSGRLVNQVSEQIEYIPPQKKIEQTSAGRPDTAVKTAEHTPVRNELMHDQDNALPSRPYDMSYMGVGVSAVIRSRSPGFIRLCRGQRINIEQMLGDGIISIELFYSSMDKNLDIDAYTFLLDNYGRAVTDENVVFFGNTSYANNAVCYSDTRQHRQVIIDLVRIPYSIERIAIAYAIYGDDSSETFRMLHDGIVMIKCGKRCAELPLIDLDNEKTIVAVELYRNNRLWRLSSVLSGYKGGIANLCESYGITVTD